MTKSAARQRVGRAGAGPEQGGRRGRAASGALAPRRGHQHGLAAPGADALSTPCAGTRSGAAAITSTARQAALPAAFPALRRPQSVQHPAHPDGLQQASGATR